MSTSTAPTKDEIAALSGSDLDNAINDAGIDASTGGSRADGSLSAQEKRDALYEHHGHQSGTDEPSRGAGAPTTDPVSADEPEGESEGQGNEDDPEEPTTEEKRDAQLAAGEEVGAFAADSAAELADMTPAEQRAGRRGATLIDGRVDNMSRRDDSDPLFGHFVRIDFDGEDGETARKAVEAFIGEGNAGVGSGDYGVWVDNGTLDPDTGYPITCTVMLRDEHAVQVPGVPHSALRNTSQGGRR